jgi:hypothetical protein
MALDAIAVLPKMGAVGVRSTAATITIHPRMEAFVVSSAAASTVTSSVANMASYAIVVRPKINAAVVRSSAAAITVLLGV